MSFKDQNQEEDQNSRVSHDSGLKSVETLIQLPQFGIPEGSFNCTIVEFLLLRRRLGLEYEEDLRQIVKWMENIYERKWDRN